MPSFRYRTRVSHIVLAGDRVVAQRIRLAKAIGTIVIVKRKLSKTTVVAYEIEGRANGEAISRIGIDNLLFCPPSKVVNVSRENVKRPTICLEPEFIACQRI